MWWLTKDGDEYVLAMHRRHYSHRSYADGRTVRLFMGPGEKLVLRTWDCDAIFGWRKFIDDSGQQGVNCAFFRNESEHRSSDLIRQADAIAAAVWPGERHYTCVDASKIRSTNPGYCFLLSGWKKAGNTKSGLIVFAKEAGT